jgi:ABC-type transporter Mla subunit MlaD
MNELEQMRDILQGLRGQINAALQMLERVIAAVNAEEEPEEVGPPKTFGGGR